MRRSIYPILVFAAVAVLVPLAGRLGAASGWVSKPWMGRLALGDDPSAAPKAVGVQPASADGATPPDKLPDAQRDAGTGASRGAASGGGSAGASAAPGAVGVGAVGTGEPGAGSATASGTGAGNGTGAASVTVTATAPSGGLKAVPKSGSGSAPGATQTAEERKAALDQRLNASLDSFDAKLRLEQQKTAQARDARQTAVATLPASGESSGAGSGGDSGGGIRSAQGSNGGGNRRTGGAESDDSHGGDLKSDQASRRASVAGNGAVATEIPDGNDDDVVARRLRKAAEQETDPELKDKLWNEYVEYKKNVQAK